MLLNFSLLQNPSTESVYNSNLIALHDTMASGKRGAVLEGGSRSGKTWSSIDFIIWLAATQGRVTINIIRESYNSFKTTIYDDFKIRLAQFPHLNKYNKFAVVQDIPFLKLFYAKINFIGADQPSKFHGAGCDYFYINEALEIQQAIFDQLEMRCRKFWWLDYNPKCSEHWIFNKLEKRTDVKFFHSTMLDNPCIGKWERSKILSYEPTKENISQGTADEYNWKVYGLGLRASPKGLIFPNVTWIDTFPTDIEEIIYGMDFGYTNSPTAIVKVGRNGKNLYIQKLFYTPTDNAADLAAAIKVLDIKGSIWADSADPGLITDLNNKGLNVYAVRKFADSIRYGIDLIKQHHIHLVRDPDLRREQENYHWREIGGISLNEPIDDFNHIWDGCRYAVLMNFRRE